MQDILFTWQYANNIVTKYKGFYLIKIVAFFVEKKRALSYNQNSCISWVNIIIERGLYEVLF